MRRSFIDGYSQISAFFLNYTNATISSSSLIVRELYCDAILFVQIPLWAIAKRGYFGGARPIYSINFAVVGAKMVLVKSLRFLAIYKTLHVSKMIRF